MIVTEKSIELPGLAKLFTHINFNLQTTHKTNIVYILQMRIVRLREVASLGETLGPDPQCRNREKSVHILRANRL